MAAFAPGLRQEPLADGLARYVQKGSKLIFECHYTPNGVAQNDRSTAGFIFADPATVKKEVAVQNAGNFTFKIPPGADHHKVESEFVFRDDSLLISLSPPTVQAPVVSDQVMSVAVLAVVKLARPVSGESLVY